MKKIILLLVFVNIGCNTVIPTQFSEQALNDTAISINNSPQTFGEIINVYKGKKVLIDVWASWCGDCVKGLPKVKKLQKEFPEVVFLFLSVDKNIDAWKKGIKRFNIKGEHFNFSKGMKDGDFVNFLNLSWIPRYLVVDKEGSISVFNAINAEDIEIIEALKSI